MSNALDQTHHLLVCLSEECAEVIQAVSKIIRFGLNDNYPGYGNNTAVLVKEVNDVVAVIEFVRELQGEFGSIGDRRLIDLKKEKLSAMMKYAIAKGTLDH